MNENTILLVIVIVVIVIIVIAINNRCGGAKDKNHEGAYVKGKNTKRKWANGQNIIDIYDNEKLTYPKPPITDRPCIDDGFQLGPCDDPLNPLLEEQSIIILYTFDVSPYTEHLYMLEASIITVLREMGALAMILVYSTTPTSLLYLQSRYNGFNGATLQVVDYIPPTDPKYEYEGGLSVFNKIGHSRIFLINQLLQVYGKPLIYLDNDTVCLLYTSPVSYWRFRIC